MSDSESSSGPNGDGGGPAGGGSGSGGLGRRFLIGGFQLGVGQWLGAALNFVIMLGVARLLGPEDFGVYAFVLSVNEVLNIVGAFSINVALIQVREAPQKLFDTAFAMSLGLGVAGLVVSFPIALWLAQTHSERAAWMLITLGVARILGLVARVPHARLERELRYGRISTIAVATGNLPNLFAIAFAWFGMGAWALVVRDLIMTAMMLALAWGWSSYRFTRQIDRAAFQQLYAISKRLFAAVSVGILVERVDRISVGSLLGDAATGLYQQARTLAETGSLAIRPVSQLALNLYARLQDDPARLSRSHELVNILFIRSMLLGAVALFAFPGEVIRFLLGEEWLGTAPLLRTFGVLAVAAPLIENIRVLFYGTGNVDRNIRVAVTQACVVIPSVLWAAMAGDLHSVALAVTASVIVALGASWFWSRDLVERHPLRLFGAPISIAALAVGGSLTALEAGALSSVPWWSLPFLPPLIFGVGLLSFERRMLWREISYLRAQLATPPTGDDAGA